MVVKFCLDDRGVILEQNREDITDLMSILKDKGEINIVHSQDDYFHGVFVYSELEIVFNQKTDKYEEELYLYFDKK
ncbi:hypothetical protein [Aneurinibacillus tyrosinisolvens]|uniref:hypothetical protein n=1 Tax=Aneurinibacillus tyrosinisolvens TaxID=1443435 RepID=UPI00063FC10E|nr:hypothetical protein [Aneurinibacillus tyrosinisolvens]